MSLGDVEEYLSKGREFSRPNQQCLARIKQSALRAFTDSSAESSQISTNQGSPSYSPLESPSPNENSYAGFSPIIHMCNIRPEFDNMYTYEVAPCSDPDSPGYDEKSKRFAEKKIEDSQERTNSNNEIMKENDQITWDYIEVFGEVIDLVTTMLDALEHAEEFTIEEEQKMDLDHNIDVNPKISATKIGTIKPVKTVSSIKIQTKISFVNSFEKQNEFERKIEEVYFYVLRLCIKNLNLNKNLAELSIEKCRNLLAEQLIDQDRNQPGIRWILLLNLCAVGLDLLFNCSTQAMLEFSRSFVAKFAHIESW